MSSFGIPEPPPYEPPPPAPPSLNVESEATSDDEGHSRVFRAVAGSAIAILVAGGVAAAVLAFGFIRGSADSMVTFAPSDTAVYVNVDLQPSAGQQLALNDIVGKFPGLSGSSRDATINHWLDSGLRPSGLSHSDVRAWLGSQVSLIVLKSSDGAIPAEVSLLASTNDTAAQAMFAKYKSGPTGQPLRWTVATYDGVTVNVGQDPSGGTQAWAITGHTVIAATSETAVDEVIDTSQGKHASLTSQADYTAVQAQVPSDRVAFLYVDVPQVSALIPSTAVAGAASSLRGYRGSGRGRGGVVVGNHRLRHDRLRLIEAHCRRPSRARRRTPHQRRAGLRSEQRFRICHACRPASDAQEPRVAGDSRAGHIRKPGT